MLIMIFRQAQHRCRKEGRAGGRPTTCKNAGNFEERSKESGVDLPTPECNAPGPRWVPLALSGTGCYRGYSQWCEGRHPMLIPWRTVEGHLSITLTKIPCFDHRMRDGFLWCSLFPPTLLLRGRFVKILNQDRAAIEDPVDLWQGGARRCDGRQSHACPCVIWPIR